MQNQYSKTDKKCFDLICVIMVFIVPTEDTLTQ